MIQVPKKAKRKPHLAKAKIKIIINPIKTRTKNQNQAKNLTSARIRNLKTKREGNNYGKQNI
jgi:hypothetical protein